MTVIAIVIILVSIMVLMAFGQGDVFKAGNEVSQAFVEKLH